MEYKNNYIKKISNAIKNFITDKNALPLYDLNDLPDIIEYKQDKDLLNPNCHLGQRKLLLTEIEFYNKCVNLDDKNNIIIYAGSASCEHLPVILKMYPKLKFILVDPNYHSINSDYKYIYQNPKVISDENMNVFLKQLKNADNNPRGIHLYHTTKKLLTMDFLYDSTTKYNVLTDIDNNKMDNFRDIFESKKDNLIEQIIKSNTRVFVIQDYMTIDLTKRLKEYIDKSKIKTNIYFLTDIRTTLLEGLGATDIDILWNSALQIIFLKILMPIFSMLKFRPTFYLEYDQVKECYEDTTGKYDYFKSDIYYVRDNYKIDLFGDYFKKDFYYFVNDFIYIQPWSPKTSSETRLFVSKENINKPYINYDLTKWENKFYWFRYVRQFKYYPIFYDKLKDNRKLHYDGCQDCAREIMILGDYIIKEKGKEYSYNLNKISEKLKDKLVVDKLIELYNLINRYTFFNLSNKNYKCREHGNIKEQKSCIIFEYKDGKKIKECLT